MIESNDRVELRDLRNTLLASLFDAAEFLEKLDDLDTTLNVIFQNYQNFNESFKSVDYSFRDLITKFNEIRVSQGKEPVKLPDMGEEA